MRLNSMKTPGEFLYQEVVFLGIVSLFFLTLKIGYFNITIK
jgi:hypothetical protein